MFANHFLPFLAIFGDLWHQHFSFAAFCPIVNAIPCNPRFAIGAMLFQAVLCFMTAFATSAVAASAALPGNGEGVASHWIAIGGTFGLMAGLAGAGLFGFLHLRRMLERMDRDFSNYEAAVAMRFAAVERAQPLAQSAAFAEGVRGVANPKRFAPVHDLASADGKVVALHPASRSGVLQEKRIRLTQAQLEDCVRQNGVVAWYQTVVSLPGRRTKYLQAQTYLDCGAGTPIAAAGWLKSAVKAGLGAEIDRQMVLHSIRTARDLRRGEKSCGVIWSFGIASLRNGETWKETANLLKANRSLGQGFVCQISLADYGQLGHDEMDRLHLLREYGLRLGLGQCNDPQMLTNALRNGIFSLVSAEAGMLARTKLMAEPVSMAPVEYIATGVATEETAIALIDHDITFAQGPLFSLPKPLRTAPVRSSAPDASR